MSTIHILGASGFLGGAISQRLRVSGSRQVRCWSSASCDLLDRESVVANFGRCPAGDRYVFAAAVPRLREDTCSAGAVNRRMLDLLLEALQGQFAHFVFLSSVDVHGMPRDGTLLHSQSPIAPIGPYAESKAWCEARLLALRRVSVLRLPGVYGVGDGGRSTVASLARRVFAGETIVAPETPPILRDYVTGQDVAGLVERALEDSIEGAFVVSTGTSLPLRRIAELVAQGAGRTARFVQPATAPVRSTDLRLDNAALRAAFGRSSPGAMAVNLVRFGERLRHGMNQ